MKLVNFKTKLFFIGVFIVLVFSAIYLKPKQEVYKFDALTLPKSVADNFAEVYDGNPFMVCEISTNKCVGLLSTDG